MKIAIVGSRRYPNSTDIWDYLSTQDDVTEIVSGGCKGPDKWAEEVADTFNIPKKIFLPQFKGTEKDYYEICNVYYARNKQIAEYADKVVAFVVDEKGGTWNTIKYAKQFNKPVEIYYPNRE